MGVEKCKIARVGYARGMDDVALMGDVLGKTADVLDGVEQSDWGMPTPCTEYTVKDLIAHIVGWSHSFEAAAEGRKPDGDPSTYQVSEKSAGEFREVARKITEGWSANGTDREVSLVGPSPMPAQMVFDMTLMEYLAHGWDLAKATGQRMPYTEAEAEAVLELSRKHVGDQWRGEGKAFGAVVDVPDSAPAIDRFAGFMGRRP